MSVLRFIAYIGAAAAGYWLSDLQTTLILVGAGAFLDVYLSWLDPERLGMSLALLIGSGMAMALLIIGGVVPGSIAPAAVFLAVMLALTLAHRLPVRPWASGMSPGPETELPCTKILDASILMDGRIVDIVEIGFMDGTIVVPRFVVRQIQHVHESGSELKRQRAGHALDLIRRFQNMKNIRFRICELDFPEERDIDHRIIALARKLKAKIVTNDYTLNRVASLKELDVLNINELANALKPVALPGESISIQLIKKGKEAGQAIGYLDDGTMVVIDGGEPYIGSRVTATITSILQNPSGKMIFGRVSTGETDQEEA